MRHSYVKPGAGLRRRHCTHACIHRLPLPRTPPKAHHALKHVWLQRVRLAQPVARDGGQDQPRLAAKGEAKGQRRGQGQHLREQLRACCQPLPAAASRTMASRRSSALLSVAATPPRPHGPPSSSCTTLPASARLLTGRRVIIPGPSPACGSAPMLPLSLLPSASPPSGATVSTSSSSLSSSSDPSISGMIGPSANWVVRLHGGSEYPGADVRQGGVLEGRACEGCKSGGGGGDSRAAAPRAPQARPHLICGSPSTRITRWPLLAKRPPRREVMVVLPAKRGCPSTVGRRQAAVAATAAAPGGQALLAGQAFLVWAGRPRLQACRPRGERSFVNIPSRCSQHTPSFTHQCLPCA